MGGEAGKGHKRRPRADTYCTEEQFNENWDRTYPPKQVIKDSDPGDENDYEKDSVRSS